ncbi:uncharacterized protein CBL_01476 [Carabus blaptoides fortunei]
MVLTNVLLVCYICVTVFCTCGVNADILDRFSHRLETDARSLTVNTAINTTRYVRNIASPAISIIEQFGYPAETHEVQTEDGYLLTLHRIPYGKITPSKYQKGRPVAILHHGILGSSDTWLLRSPDKDLAFILADNGYDVWISNVRGNVYSRKHISLDPDKDKQFWNFSFHEIGYYDLPATIDYVLNVTNQKSLFYICHSMGCTVFFILCSTRPEYNSKIRLMHGLAPAVYIVHKPSPLMKLIISNTPSLVQSCKEQNIYELFPLRKFTGRLGRALCHKTSPTQPFCLAGVFLVAGVDYQQLNTTLLPKIFEHYPAGSSLNTFMHFYQNIVSGSFHHMDFGEADNLIHYKQKTPPEYNLKKVSAPVSLFYGDGDYLIKKEDTEMLASKLSNLVGLFKVPFPFFNHLDFLWGTDAKPLSDVLTTAWCGVKK